MMVGNGSELWAGRYLKYSESAKEMTATVNILFFPC